VIDDVISSGETVGKLRKENKSFIPAADWLALTWVKQRAFSTKDYSVVFSAKTVGTEKCRVPINSLSTLIERPEIAKCYARRNFGNKVKDFEEIIGIFR
jgi:hypothetical protein